MIDLEILRKCVDPSIKMNQINLSYVAKIFHEFKDTSYIVLYKEKAIEHPNEDVKCFEEAETSKFDITGSPLKYSFAEEYDFEDSMILIKQNWCKVEEKYLPLTRTEACKALNACIGFLNDSFPPILAICDGKDIKKSRLLGVMIKTEWFTTIEVCSGGIESFDVIEKSNSKILEQHIGLSQANEHDIDVSAFITFDLFGTKEELISWENNTKNNFEGSLSIEVETCTLSMSPPTGASKNILVAQIITNSNISSLKELWKQLLLLDQYLNIIETYKNIANTTYVPLKFPRDFTSPYKQEHDKILQNINFLLNGDYNFKNPSNGTVNNESFVSEENVDNDINIEKYVQSLPIRYNLDLTDHLWELLIKNSTYLELTKCIDTVLTETIINGCFPQVNFSNPTRFAKIITDPHQPKIISHFLSSSLPLEYVIEMGFEKLCRDYIYILMNAKFGELYSIQQRLKGEICHEFSVETYRNKLLYLVQIHVCLEFISLMQNNLECPSDDLRSLFSSAFKQYSDKKSPIKSNADLHESKVYTLRVPLPVSVINNLNKVLPSMRRISLSSESKLSKLTTIKHYSQLPIFPTNIYPAEDTDVTELTYHVTSAICSSNKFK